MEQTERKRSSALVVGAAATVVIVSLLGIAATAGRVPLAGSLPLQKAQKPAGNPVEPTRPASAPEPSAPTQPCATCGTVESVRALEVKGGAAAGHEFEKQVSKNTVYRVTIRMDDGSYRTISQPTVPGYGVGEKVRIIDSSVVARG